ncbi:MAG TPA: sigma factor-like helix-turn-helix DNA-binding protein [Candidatus Solibacter sp.]|nr:sigma factor-like helix-turn-helix DNA-binding protein [Candidatus Solibacter sp.]
MTLDIERRRRLLALADAYSQLLTEHQREVLRLHLERDWSYAEIAEAQGVSRTAVYDMVHRSEAVLRDYETKLGLVAASEQRERNREEINSRLAELQGELSDLKKTVKELT